MAQVVEGAGLPECCSIPRDRRRARSCPPVETDGAEREAMCWWEVHPELIPSTCQKRVQLQDADDGLLADTCAPSETQITLPSLVDDRESSCESVEAAHPPPRGLPGLNAEAAAFIPKHRTEEESIPALVEYKPQPPQLPVLGQHQLDAVPWPAVAGHALHLASTQDGARLLQRLVPAWPAADVESLFEELRPHVTSLMRETCGNFVLQKLLEYNTPAIRSGFASCLTGNMFELSLQPYACRMVQKVLDVVSEDQCAALASELDGKVSLCVQDQHGNHVVQKFVDLLPHRSSFIVRSFVGRVEHVATHSYGCRVVQRILEKCRESPEIVQVLEEILHHVQRLSLDQYGNYVVQHVVKHGHPQYQFAISTKLAGRFALMSTHKFASNVIEKMLEFVEGCRAAILRELLLPSASDQSLSALAVSAMDPYGNYVVQKLLDLGTDQQKRTIQEHLRPFMPLLSRSHHAKNLQQRLKALAHNNGQQYHRGVLSAPGVSQHVIHLPVQKPQQQQVTPSQQYPQDTTRMYAHAPLHSHPPPCSQYVYVPEAQTHILAPQKQW